MWLNQVLLLMSSLSLHAGFSYALGLLVVRSRRLPSTWPITLAFAIFIFIPSCLVVSSLDVASGLRYILLGLGLLCMMLPGLAKNSSSSGYPSPRMRNLYPAVSMLILAAWSLLSLVNGGGSSTAPLALSSSIAGLAVMNHNAGER